MIEVNVHEAKTRLSRLLIHVNAGEEVVISRYGKPTARLVPFEELPKPRSGGSDRGLFQVPEGFDDEMPGLNRLFEEGDCGDARSAP